MNSHWKQTTARFLTAQTISLFGSSLVQYAIVWYITLSTSSGRMLTISTICGFAPQIIISLFAGVWIDRYDRKKLIMVSDAVIALATLAFVLLVDKRLLLLGVPIILGGLAFLPQKVLDRITSIGSTVDTSNLYRIKIWHITMDVIRDNLIAGVGFGYMPFKDTFERYIRTMPIYHAHNTYLEVAAEIGLIGFIFFMLLLLSTLKYAYVKLVKSEDKYFKYLGAGLFASIIGIMGHGLVEHFLYIPRIIFTFWIVLGIIFTAIKVEKDERKKLSEINSEEVENTNTASKNTVERKPITE